MIKHILYRLFWVILFTLFSSQVLPQRVAVVLSGGGAKGLAHVGVLKALEEYEIPVDYIAGTSMGAVIGGLYASGYSPDSIAKIVSSSKFSDWTSREIDDQYAYYFKQHESNASWITVKFNYDDVKRKITGKFPVTLLPSFELDFSLIELYGSASAAANYDFNDLFVPFRCVAADIDSNQAVIFSKGQLGTAVRASMTFPFYFKPIEVDGKFLFDGGMYNNFPSDIAMQDFNPDVIIGSKAAGNYRSPADDDLILQLQNMLMKPADFELDSTSGILLEHNLSDRSLFDFSRAEEVIEVGYKTTIDNMGGIYDLVDRRVASADLVERRKDFQAAKPPVMIDSVKISGLNNNQSAYVRKLLKQKGKLVGLQEVKQQYFKLIADEKISSIYPELKYNTSSGYYDLYLNIRKSENFVGFFGGNISSSTSNTAFIGLEYRYFGKQAMKLSTNVYLGRFYNSFKLGGRIDFPSHLPFFMELGYIYNSKNYFQNTTYFFDDITPSFLITRESFGYFAMGIPVTTNGILSAGLNYGGRKDDYYQDNTFSREDTADITSFDLYTPFIKFDLNSLNRRQFATTGARFMVGLSYVNGKERHTPGSTSNIDVATENNRSWFELKLLYDNYFDHFGPVSLGFYGEVQLSNQPFFDNYTSSLLVAPSFEPIVESKTLFLPKYRANNYGAAGLKFILKVYRKIDFRLEGYLFQPYQEILSDENMNAEYGKEFAYRSVIGSTSVVWHTPLGPLSMSVNYYDRNNDKYSFMFNFGYIIFNSSLLR